MLKKIKAVEKDHYIVWQTTDGFKFYWYMDAYDHQKQIDHLL